MKNNEAYLIDYRVYFTLGPYQIHTTKVKNCMGELHAKIKLEDWLKKKHSNFERMEIIKCEKDLFSVFGNLFGKNSPFNF